MSANRLKVALATTVATIGTLTVTLAVRAQEPAGGRAALPETRARLVGTTTAAAGAAAPGVC